MFYGGGVRGVAKNIWSTPGWVDTLGDRKYVVVVVPTKVPVGNENKNEPCRVTPVLTPRPND